MNYQDINISEYSTEQFRSFLASYGLSLSETQIGQFLCYYEILKEWNQFMNLTAITEYDDVILKHFVDSLSIVKMLKSDYFDSSVSILDIGTGAGFPGIPLKIAFPECKVTLLDSLNKRIKFLNQVIESLELDDIVAVHGRAEEFVTKPGMREGFDLVVSRAVANLSTLSEYCVPYVKIGGMFIPYKSDKIDEEVNAASNALSILGAKITDSVSFDLPSGNQGRTLLKIEKKKNTPKKYPRKAGLPAKEPLA